MIARITILDEVFCSVQAPHHMTQLYDLFAFKAKGHFHMPAFKMGKWDGNIRYFQKSGHTYNYLLEQIVVKLVQWGYEIKLEDRRESLSIVPDPIDNSYLKYCGIELREYQVDGINAILPHSDGIIGASTGGGKTIIVAAVAKIFGNLGFRTLVIVPNLGLVTQTIDEGFLPLKLDVGGFDGQTRDLNHVHVVGTWQSLKDNPTVVQQFHVLFVDESHGQKCNSLQALICQYGKNAIRRYGCTGTMPKDPTDCLSVNVALGPVRYMVKSKKLIDEGYLAFTNIEMVQLKEDLRAEHKTFCKENKLNISYVEFKKQYFPDYNSEKEYLYKKNDRKQFIADFIQVISAREKGNTLILVDRVQYAEQIAELIPNCHYVKRQDKREARKEIYKLFDSEDNIVVIATIHLVGTGINIKRIFNMVLLDSTKSFTKILQGLGRGLRKAEDKDSVWLYDIYGDMKYSSAHARERENMYRDEGYPVAKTEIDY